MQKPCILKTTAHKLLKYYPEKATHFSASGWQVHHCAKPTTQRQSRTAATTDSTVAELFR